MTVFKRIWTNVPILVPNVSVFLVGVNLLVVVNPKAVSRQAESVFNKRNCSRCLSNDCPH